MFQLAVEDRRMLQLLYEVGPYPESGLPNDVAEKLNEFAGRRLVVRARGYIDFVYTVTLYGRRAIETGWAR